MRNRNTIEFLALWEELHNQNFNRVQFDAVKNEAGLNRFIMTPTKWIQQMNAIGIVVKSGRYSGGTYAHTDIVMSFTTWISPEFQLYIMKDYRRLKANENSRLSLNWNLNREIAKLNYRIHTNAIKDIECIDIYLEKPENGCWIRNLVFNFPMPIHGKEMKTLPLEAQSTVETVALLSHKAD